MQFYNDGEGGTEPNSYASSNLIVDEDAGGNIRGDDAKVSYGDSGSGGGSDIDDDTKANDGDTGSGGGSDFEDDDDSSWTEDSTSYAGTSVSSSGAEDGVKSVTKAPKANKVHSGKWLKTLWSMMDRIDGGGGDHKGRGFVSRPSQQPVKSILRPPTKYKYVVGMSGFPSKVPIYPKRK